MRRSFIRVVAVLVLLLGAGLGALALLQWQSRSEMEVAIDSAEVTGCRKNLVEIYKGLMAYRSKNGEMPRARGVRFLAAPVLEGVWMQSQASSNRLTCPAVPLEDLGTPAPRWDRWWVSPEAVDGSYSSYAGRDMVSFPSEELGPKDVLVACDNAHGPNHLDLTNVLLGDGVVRSLSLQQLIDEGVLPKGTKSIPVGPDSPVESLRKLSLD